MQDVPLIHELFEQAAARYPDNVALKAGHATVTYAELMRRSASVAASLRARGVGESPDELVALFVAPSLDMVIGVLGILRAGAAYVPLDVSSPESRLELIVGDAQPKYMLTSKELYERASALSEDAEALIVADLAADDDVEAPGGPRPSPDSIAYIIYTSGTTGRPKGVMNTHRNVSRLLSKTNHWYGFAPSDVVPLFHSIAFDVSVWELWTALCHGGKLVIVPKDVRRDPPAFRALLADEGVTLLNQTPSAFQMLAQEERKHESHLSTLRGIVFAGEKLNFFKLREWVEKYGTDQPKLINMYGITETCVHVTYYEVTEHDVEIGVHSRIGVPIPDLSIHILDEDLQPVANEVEGELYVEGPGLARGYFRRPELTAQRFIDNPHGEGKLYKSGDIVRRSAAGALEYIGRNDHQVKIRGFRIELGEVERAVLTHPEVEYAVAAKVDDRLVSWFAPVPEDVEPIRAHVRGRVPDYMVPLMVPVPSIPLNANGKADLRALRAIKLSTYRKGGDPRNDEEQLLADIWRAELGTDAIGIQDNYFDLGGDSIRALRMLALVQEAGFSFSIPTLYRNPTIETLAKHLVRAEREAKIEPFSLISEADRELLPATAVDAYPLSMLQCGMLYETERQGGCGIYHDVYSYCVRLRLDEALFAEAVQEMIRRHPVARTSLHLTGFSSPMQVVHKDRDAKTTTEDISHLDAEGQRRAVVDYIAKRKDEDWPFDTGPLVHFHAQRRAEDSCQINFSFHHAVLDGWSLSAFLTELVTIYAGLLSGTPTEPVALDCSFADYIALELDAKQDEAAAAFWEARTDAMSYAPLPRRPPVPELEVPARTVPKSEQLSLSHVMSAEYDLCDDAQKAKTPMRVTEVAVDKQTSVRLKELAAEWNVPLHIVLLAVHVRVLSGLFGDRQVTTGVVTNGRPERQGADRLLGLFLNVLPLQVILEPDQSWKDLCRGLMEDYQRGLEHRRYPLASMLGPGKERLFDAVFNFVEFHVYSELGAVADVDWQRSVYFEANEFGVVPYFIVDENGRLLLRLYAAAEQMTYPELIEAGRFYGRTMSAVAEAPHQAITAQPVLSEAERTHVLERFGVGGGTGVTGPHVHGRFLAQVQAQPDEVAARQGERSITYAELDEAVERLAEALTGQGVKAGATVALGLSRSIEMVTAVLACLRLGACYVPVDPTYPQERIDLLIRDSAPLLMLTQQRFSRTGKTGLPMVIVDRQGNLRGLKHLTFEQLEGADVTTTGRMRDAAKDLDPELLAYVIYTSGSTGVPKGVQITRENIRTLVHDYLEAFPLQAGDRMLQSFAFGFDGFQLELLPALSAGATLVFTELDDPVPEDITAMTLTPSLLSVRRPKDFPNLRLLGAGGEALRAEHLAPWYAPGRRIFNLYGPTECTIVTTVREQTDPEVPITIGRPLPNYRAYVISDLGEACAVGVPGELCVAGPGLARGYLHRPEEDQQHFVDNPLVPEERIYRTGDRVAWTAEGDLAFYGRRDGQVKLRGFRVELGEIEAILNQVPTVRQAVVVVHESVLAAFVQRMTDEELQQAAADEAEGRVSAPPPLRGKQDLSDELVLDADLTDCRTHAAKNLPSYMQPTLYVALRELPTDANGKVARRALQGHVNELAALTRHDSVTAPRDARELELVRLFEALLGLETLGIDDDFFGRGGDSLKAMRLLTRIEESTGQRLSLARFLEAPTVRGVTAQLANVAPSAVVRLQPEGDAPPFFCVHPAIRTAFCYRELAQALGTDQPFYGIEATGRENATSLDELAAAYVAEVRAVQPEGPYYLGGWSAGGNIALAMAAHLEAEGQEVGLVAPMDSRPPKNLSQHALTQALNDDSTAALALVARLIESMSGATLEGVFEMLTALPESERLSALGAKVEALGVFPEGTGESQVERFYTDLREVSGYVVGSAEALKLPRKMTLFVAQQPEPAADGSSALDDVTRDPTLGWREEDIEAEYVYVNGSHQTMVYSPHVERLARRLRAALRAARGDERVTLLPD